ncbi:MAG: hypothetical protein K2K89_10525 [Ruminococcus sp.]|nr:hypothetical protein [Ruminococcus sp.]
MNKNADNEALNAVGPSFEELSEENMVNIEGEATPAVVSVVATKLIVTALTGYAVTCTIDRICK